MPIRCSVAAKRATSHIFERATLNYIDWFNNRRIHESLDYVSSALRTFRGCDHSQSSFGGEEEVVA